MKLPHSQARFNKDIKHIRLALAKIKKDMKNGNWLEVAEWYQEISCIGAQYEMDAMENYEVQIDRKNKNSLR